MSNTYNKQCNNCNNYIKEDSVKTPAGLEFCCISCAVEFSIKKSNKLKEIKIIKLSKKDEKRNKEERKILMQRKMDVKPISYWMNRAQTAFNNFIRYRDMLDVCISCKRNHTGQYHAGHYISTADSPFLRFHEDNCHKQCSVCNNYRSANLTRYRLSLIKKIGIDRVLYLEEKHEKVIYNREDYQKIEAKYKLKLKELKSIKTALQNII